MQKYLLITVIFSIVFIASSVILEHAEARQNPCHAPPYGNDACAVPAVRANESFTPTVDFPSKSEIFSYLNETGEKSEFVYLNNLTQGNASNINTAIANKTIWVAWEGSINGVNHVFISASNDEGRNFIPTTELTNNTITNNANISNLQLGVTSDEKNVLLAWESKNLTSGKRSIYFSTSMDYGQTFRTYVLNDADKEEFFDPRLTVEGDTVWFTWLKITEDGDIYAGGHGRRW